MTPSRLARSQLTPRRVARRLATPPHRTSRLLTPRRVVLGVLVAVCLLGWLGAPAAAAPLHQVPGYVIEDFSVDIDLASDGSMTVEESISVRFDAPRRGIIRRIPVDYPTGQGVDRRVEIDVRSVVDADGQPYQTQVTREGDELRIRVGDPDVTLDPGTRKTYRIIYEAVGMLNWFEGSVDWEPAVELYWNVTGDEWDTAIQTSGVTIRYPQVQEPERIRVRAFAGPYGSTESDTAIGPTVAMAGPETGTELDIAADRAQVTLDRPLDPFEGLTIVLQLPGELIARPSLWDRFRLYVLPNMGLTLPLWVLGIMFGLWWRRGRDPEAGPLVVRYNPPDDLTGPEAGALIDERVDQRDVAAGIIELAGKGYLELHPKEEGTLFKRETADIKLTDQGLTGETQGLTAFEAGLLRDFRQVGATITDEDLRTEVAPGIDGLKGQLYESLVNRGYYRQSPSTARIVGILTGVAVVVVLGGLFFLLSPTRNPIPVIIGGFLALPLALGFGYLMPRRTKAGAEAHQAVRGFEEFISRAHRKELQWQTEIDPTQALFERLLPHAVAFGLVSEWVDAFGPILVAPPEWYHTPAGTPFHAHHFGRDLSAVSSAVGSAAVTPPRSSGASGGSSGFGGGGFSGGGFGGGGGGSW